MKSMKSEGQKKGGKRYNICTYNIYIEREKEKERERKRCNVKGGKEVEREMTNSMKLGE